MDTERLERQLAFLREMDKLKSVVRNTLLLDRSRCETDAEHSWHMAVCAMLLAEYADEPVCDFSRLLKMILLHDTVEIYAGDTYAFADPELLAGQSERERAAADKLFAILPPDQAAELRALWDEFEEGETPEAKCARIADTFLPLYHNYLTNGEKWRELGATRDRVFKRAEWIRKGSTELYAFVSDMLTDSVEKGYLPVE